MNGIPIGGMVAGGNGGFGFGAAGAGPNGGFGFGAGVGGNGGMMIINGGFNGRNMGSGTMGKMGGFCFFSHERYILFLKMPISYSLFSSTYIVCIIFY